MKLINNNSTDKTPNDCLLRIKDRYNIFNSSEKKIADYFFEDFSNINKKKLVITDIAEKIDISPATIVRFCKTLGYSGFTDFKYAFSNSSLNENKFRFDLEEKDNIESIIAKANRHASEFMHNTVESLNRESLKLAVNAIIKAKKIMIIGEGASGGTCHTFAVILANMGFPVILNTDSVLNAIQIANFTKDDLCIGINNHGNNKDVIDLFSIAKKNGATTISISGTPKSLLISKSTISLLTFNQSVSSVFDFPSITICQMQVVGIIQACLMQKEKGNLDVKIKNSRKAAKKKVIGVLEYK